MASPTVHEMKLRSEPFGKIRRGEKRVELRLFDEKRQQIREGDFIRFTETETGETVTVRVKKLHPFASFEELYRSLSLRDCGYGDAELASAHPSDMERYYAPEAQKKYGVVGIEISLADGNALTEN